MNDSSLDDKRVIASRVFGGAGLKASAFILVRVIQIARVTVLARIFSPHDIGTAALAMSCVSVACLFADLGASHQVIRNPDAPDELGDSAFTISLLLGLLVFVILLAGAPFLSHVFSTEIDGYVRFLAITALGSALLLPSSFWIRDMRFGHPTVIMLLPDLVNFVLAISLQLILKMGIWSLVIGQGAGFMVSVIYVWLFAARRPKLRFNRASFTSQLQFGLPLMMSGINYEMMMRGDNLMVGGFYGPARLAYYNIAWQLPLMMWWFTQSIASTLYPVYARLQRDKQALGQLFNFTCKLWSLTGSFFGCAIILFADVIVRVLFGERWMPAVNILRVMTFAFILRYCIGQSYETLVVIRGRTGYMMKWGCVGTVFLFTLGLMMIKLMGPIGGAWFWVIHALVIGPLSRLPFVVKELGSLDFLKHIWQPMFSGVVSSCVVLTIRFFLLESSWHTIVLNVISYCVVFIGTILVVDRAFIPELRRLFAMAKQGKQ